MPEHLVDIGVNLTDRAFHNDLDQVIARAHESGVGTMIVTGTNLSESQ